MAGQVPRFRKPHSVRFNLFLARRPGSVNQVPMQMRTTGHAFASQLREKAR